MPEFARPDAASLRPYRPADRAAVLRITVESFPEVSIDWRTEQQLGPLGDRTWQERKARQVEQELDEHPAGCVVAEQAGQVVGYVTTTIDPWARKGRIPNLAVAPNQRSQGLGRRLLEAALALLRSEGLAWVVIETLANNDVGQHLYPDVGFLEVARQVHYAMRIEP